ncbi:MAG: hypothetical protein ACJAVI_003479 [Candidatus Azotimanducaceae bacterium]|jgi:hypothetical protein
MIYRATIVTVFLFAAFNGDRTMASGDWIQVSTQHLFEQADVILVGKLVGQQEIKPGDEPFRVGVIVVETVVKNSVVDTTVGAIVLLQREDRYTPGLVSSVEIAYDVGSHGLWFLQMNNVGFYTATHPQQFIPLQEMTSVLEEITGF